MPNDEKLVNDHDLDSNEPFFRMLPDGETFERPALDATEQELVASWATAFDDNKVICKLCDMYTTIPPDDDMWQETTEGRRTPYVPSPPHMDLKGLVHHMKTK